MIRWLSGSGDSLWQRNNSSISELSGKVLEVPDDQSSCGQGLRMSKRRGDESLHQLEPFAKTSQSKIQNLLLRNASL